MSYRYADDGQFYRCDYCGNDSEHRDPKRQKDYWYGDDWVPEGWRIVGVGEGQFEQYLENVSGRYHFCCDEHKVKWLTEGRYQKP